MLRLIDRDAHFKPLLLLIPVIVAVLMYASFDQMLWKMKLVAPMYPAGLMMEAYGSTILGDLSEINLLNHYVGMHPITPESIGMMALYPFGVGAVILFALATAILPKYRKLFSLATFSVPIVMLGTIQYYLYKFGHDLNPDAPIDLPPFTPLVLGKSTIVNFHSIAFPGLAMAFYVAAAFVLWFAPRVILRFRPESVRRAAQPTKSRNAKLAATALLVGAPLITLTVPSASAAGDRSFRGRTPGLQTLIDEATAGDTLRIAGGVYSGAIRIDKPLTLIGLDRPTIDGERKGTVVTVTSDHVTVRGFRIVQSGFEIHEDAAGVNISGNDITIEDNVIAEVYFGIHATNCGSVSLLRNRIAPGLTYTSRPGHNINVWNVKKAVIQGNELRDGRDGILLTYVDSVLVDSNSVSRCRYGLHSMYSKNLFFTRNTLDDNLLGIALMYSQKLTATGNTMSRHRRGSSPYGFLLKDIDFLTIEDNRILGNQIGIFADAVSMLNGSESTIRRNVIASNEIALSMQSNVRIAFVGNSVIDNMIDLEKQGAHLNAGCTWSEGGKGNYWSNYRGYDRTGDSAGDLPYRVEDLTERVIDRSSSARIFLYTPAHLILEAAVRMFPLFRPPALLEDSSPLMCSPSSESDRVVSASAANVSLAVALCLVWLLSARGLAGWRPLSFRR